MNKYEDVMDVGYIKWPKDYTWIPWYLKLLKLSGSKIQSLVLRMLAKVGVEFCGYCKDVVVVGHPNYVCSTCWDSWDVNPLHGYKESK